MNLKDNLKKLRKDNNLSQEDLAEKLNVSRQSVSKWEQGLAYPEMDKVIQICNMFNLNIDEFLNQDITKVEQIKQSKTNVNKYIDDFLAFVTKTVKMFWSMKFKDKIKCIIEQIFIIGVLLLICVLIGDILDSIFNSIFSFLKDGAYYTVHNLFEGIYYLIYSIFAVIVILHIFKIRYLDYYEIVDNTDDSEEEVKEEKEEKEEIKESKKEKIIIRDPKHSGYRFINGIFKIFLFFVKGFLFFVGLCFCAAFVGFVFILTSSFLITKTGLLFVGCLLASIAGILLNLIFIYMIFYFISNMKINKKLVFISMLLTLLLSGVSIGLMAYGIKDFKIITDNTSEYLITSNDEMDMNKKIFFSNDEEEIEYVVSNNSNIKLEYKHSNLCDIRRINHGNEIYFIPYCADGTPIKEFIKSLNKKIIVNPDTFKVIIYTNKENIKILKNNYKEYSNKIKRIDELNQIIVDLENKIVEKQMELESMN